MKQHFIILAILTLCCSTTIHYSGNPVFTGWDDDSEGAIFGKKKTVGTEGAGYGVRGTGSGYGVRGDR